MVTSQGKGEKGYLRLACWQWPCQSVKELLSVLIPHIICFLECLHDQQYLSDGSLTNSAFQTEAGRFTKPLKGPLASELPSSV